MRSLNPGGAVGLRAQDTVCAHAEIHEFAAENALVGSMVSPTIRRSPSTPRPMPYAYTVEERIVHVSWHGVITAGDLETFGVEMPQVGRQLGFAPDVIHTFEGVTGNAFQPIAAYIYSLQQKRVPIPNPVHVAIVATSPESEALATVFKTLNRASSLEMKVFANETAARLWLAQK